MVNDMLIIALFSLFFIKHYFADFRFQTYAMVVGKGIYGDWKGIQHSAIQAFFTGCIVGGFTQHVGFTLAMVGLDFFIHYHVDYIKMRYGIKDMQQPKYWYQLGLDQLAHYMTYSAIIALSLQYI